MSKEEKKLQKVAAKEEKKAKKLNKKKSKNKSLFFTDLKKELKQVKWPSFKEILKYTIATIVLILIIAILFAGLNILISFVKELFS